MTDSMGASSGAGTFDAESAKKEIQKRRDRIDALEKRRHGFKNYRYVLDLDLSPLETSATLFDATPPAFPRVEGAVNVAAGTVFHVKAMEAIYSVVGVTSETGDSVTMVVPPPKREAFFTFQYRVRDTGSDREWDGGWVPGAALLGANLNVLRIGRGRAFCSGGAQIVVQVRAQTVGTASNLGLASISRHLLKFSFIGVEVKQ